MDSWPQPQVSGIGLLEAVGLRMCTQDRAQVMLLHTGFENTGLRWRFTTSSARVNQREHNDEVRQDAEMLIPWACPSICQRLQQTCLGRGGGMVVPNFLEALGVLVKTAASGDSESVDLAWAWVYVLSKHSRDSDQRQI